MRPATSERLRLAPLDEVPDGLCVLSEGWIVVFWNRQLEAWTGVPRERIVGRDLRERFPSLAAGERARRLCAALSGETPPDTPDELDLVAEGTGPEPRPARKLRARVLPFAGLDVCRYALLQLRDGGDASAGGPELQRERALRRELEARVDDLSAQLVLEQARSDGRASELEKQAELAARGRQELLRACSEIDRALARVADDGREPPPEPRPAPARRAAPPPRRPSEDLFLPG